MYFVLQLCFILSLQPYADITISYSGQLFGEGILLFCRRCSLEFDPGHLRMGRVKTLQFTNITNATEGKQEKYFLGFGGMSLSIICQSHNWNHSFFILVLLYSHIIHIHMHAESQRRNNKDKRHSSLEKYTSHFIWKGSKGLLKVLLCERWIGGWTELQHIDPHSYGHNSVSFPFSWAAQLGAWGPSLSGTWSSFQHLLSNWFELPIAGVI